MDIIPDHENPTGHSLEKSLPSVQEPVSVPMSHLLEEAKTDYERLSAADEAVRKEVEKYARDLRQKLSRERGIDSGFETWREKMKQGEAESKELVREFIKDAYEGKYGKGELVYARLSDPNDSPQNNIIPKIQLIRAIPLKGASPKELKQFYERRKAIERILSEDDMTDGDGNLSCHFARVSLDKTPGKEIQIFFDEHRDNYNLNELLGALPRWFKPTLRVGDVFNFGGVSHHTGNVYGSVVILPTGRCAVIFSYSGDRNSFEIDDRSLHESGDKDKSEGVVCLGALSDPRTEPRWSAKGFSFTHGTTSVNPKLYPGSWEGELLEPFTKEELDFLRERNWVNEEDSPQETDKYPLLADPNE